MINREMTVEQLFTRLPLGQVSAKCQDTWELHGFAHFVPNPDVIRRVLAVENKAHMFDTAYRIVEQRLDALQ